jgi:hypothetical protein
LPSDSEHPRDADEWRVEVEIEDAGKQKSLVDRLSGLHLDDEARKQLGGSIIVTRDGPHLFIYAWHEYAAREAERVIRELIEEDGLAGEVSLSRWHPVEDAWRPADEPLPESKEERAEERRRHFESESEAYGERGRHEWQVIVDLPDLTATSELARKLKEEGLPVNRHWKYLLVGVVTEEEAVRLGKQIEETAPEDSHVGVRANPRDLPAPGIVFLSGLRP